MSAALLTTQLAKGLCCVLVTCHYLLTHAAVTSRLLGIPMKV